jgi:hypothetical protein
VSAPYNTIVPYQVRSQKCRDTNGVTQVTTATTPRTTQCFEHDVFLHIVPRNCTDLSPPPSLHLLLPHRGWIKRAKHVNRSPTVGLGVSRLEGCGRCGWVDLNEDVGFCRRGFLLGRLDLPAELWSHTSLKASQPHVAQNRWPTTRDVHATNVGDGIPTRAVG